MNDEIITPANDLVAIPAHLGTVQVTMYRKPVNNSFSFQEEGLQLDRFAQVMKLCQNLSDDKPFKPEWLFNKEMPEEVKLYLRQIFQQRIKGITSSVDVSQLSDEQLMEFAPMSDESLNAYASRVTDFINSLKGDS